MNLNRIGNWAADDYCAKRKRILSFLDQTTAYIQSLQSANFKSPFIKTYQRFLKEYSVLEHIGRQGPQDNLAWAEQMMTWGNILTHRAKLIDKHGITYH